MCIVYRCSDIASVYVLLPTFCTSLFFLKKKLLKNIYFGFTILWLFTEILSIVFILTQLSILWKRIFILLPKNSQRKHLKADLSLSKTCSNHINKQRKIKFVHVCVCLYHGSKFNTNTNPMHSEINSCLTYVVLVYFTYTLHYYRIHILHNNLFYCHINCVSCEKLCFIIIFVLLAADIKLLQKKNM